MEYFYLALWFLVPLGLQMILLEVSRDRMRPLRYVLLIPLGLLISFALFGLGSMFAASWMPGGDGLIGLITSLFTLGLILVCIPFILLLAVLFFLGWALAWSLFDLWERRRSGGASG